MDTTTLQIDITQELQKKYIQAKEFLSTRISKALIPGIYEIDMNFINNNLTQYIGIEGPYKQAASILLHQALNNNKQGKIVSVEVRTQDSDPITEYLKNGKQGDENHKKELITNEKYKQASNIIQGKIKKDIPPIDQITQEYISDNCSIGVQGDYGGAISLLWEQAKINKEKIYFDKKSLGMSSQNNVISKGKNNISRNISNNIRDKRQNTMESEIKIDIKEEQQYIIPVYDITQDDYATIRYFKNLLYSDSKTVNSLDGLYKIMPNITKIVKKYLSKEDYNLTMKRYCSKDLNILSGTAIKAMLQNNSGKGGAIRKLFDEIK